ncbi:glycosyltransferase [Aristophania vespae]|uniref:Glycosyltransferase n=1 Tax=Aristophania vespae TaxID=2697033 RepID=A0A6P1NFC0_9PROT|nr:glycosyltransferase family 4 protein [Aristophania vespae]QHI96003.1 glycosyltransferase [Aristophania vespae]UMM63764.1 D-inositol 3-phosphate glycosyltransferase [Aristophania vespae]
MIKTKKPCILQVLPKLDAGGIEQGTLDIAEAVAKAGGRAIVVSEGGRLLPRLRFVGGEHVTLSLKKSASPLAYFRNVRRLRKICEEYQVDLIHARSRYPAWVALKTAKKEKIPFITTWHGVHDAHSVAKRIYNSVLVKGALVIAVSQHISQKIQHQFKIAENKIKLIPRGCDADFFCPESVSGTRVQALIERWYIPEGSRVILMAGRLTPWKGQSFLIEALAALKDDFKEEWVCVLAGVETKEKFARKLHIQAQKAGIADRLRFVGNCSDMPAAYAAADVVVVPSLKPEPFGRVAIEAQMMGRPVIGTREGGLAETILDNQTGILVEANDVKALRNALIDVLTAERENLVHLAQIARQHALKYFAKNIMQSATLKIYDEILKTDMYNKFAKKLVDE